jgi:hypothetical protein
VRLLCRPARDGLRLTARCVMWCAGLFARARIPAGALVWHNHDHFVEGAVTKEQIDGMTAEGQRIMKRHCFQVDDDLFIGPTTEGETTRDARWYMNHSCDPNVW